MIDLKGLKHKIESHSLDIGVLIFVRGKSVSTHFLCSQYVHEIIDNVSDVTYVNSINDIVSIRNNAFITDENLIILDIDILNDVSDKIFTYNNIIIICNQVSNDAKEMCDSHIIEFPELENWHIEDYILSNCRGLSDEDAKQIATLSNYDIYRVCNEINKISIFDEEYQKLVCKTLIEEDFAFDISNYDIFSLVNPIISHDYETLCKVWEKISTFDSDPMYLLSVLIGQYKTIINVMLYPNSTPDSCGISQKRFNAIKYYYKNYTRKQLIQTYSFLSGIDKQLKTGELSDINLLDFIIINTVYKSTEV